MLSGFLKQQFSLKTPPFQWNKQRRRLTPKIIKAAPQRIKSMLKEQTEKKTIKSAVIEAANKRPPPAGLFGLKQLITPLLLYYIIPKR